MYQAYYGNVLNPVSFENVSIQLYFAATNTRKKENYCVSFEFNTNYVANSVITFSFILVAFSGSCNPYAL